MRIAKKPAGWNEWATGPSFRFWCGDVKTNGDSTFRRCKEVVPFPSSLPNRSDPMEKEQTRSAAKTPAKAKATLRKITVRNLAPRKGTEVKGGTYSVGSRHT